MLQVSDYRAHPEFGPQIADRVWNAWWKGAGLQLADVVHHLTEMGDANALPVAFVAHDEEGYAGSAFLIHSDLEERPELCPWVAAVWVEDARRSEGVGTALLKAAAVAAAQIGHPLVYTCCDRSLERFYLASGWTLMERDVGPHALSVLSLDTGAVAKA